ncbi:GNAT family N-acetyltransferase [Parabacteroides chinchillae]|uniref:Predicted N-acetyltransferase YhbS n=1 Tax=Parabacteroides chinchillae TaxID=871327 RepID=A0A8G2F4H2_9BACT|nr:N-acetyltransferase [Parabacteroides chinchillae]SEF69962.1 Predicted N-acetyltransferase YhbS [Parabacteroides chinchillae]
MKTGFTVRQTTEADYSTVYNLIQIAFLTAEHRDGNEQDYAVGLRNSDKYIPELDLVAEFGGKLIGHIMFTKTYVTKPDGSKYDTLLVAPLSVLLEYRSHGVGSALMKEGFRIAESLGYGSAFLIGDPNYYQRFGYRLSHLFGINHESFPVEYVMAKEITADSLDGISGLISM